MLVRAASSVFLLLPSYFLSFWQKPRSRAFGQKLHSRAFRQKLATGSLGESWQPGRVFKPDLDFFCLLASFFLLLEFLAKAAQSGLRTKAIQPGP